MIIIQTQTATVYKGGGKRYFTKRAAYRNAARAKIKTRCDCEPAHYADDETGYMPVMCRYHENYYRYNALVDRLCRWYSHVDRAAQNKRIKR